jgi:hypothetical protein
MNKFSLFIIIIIALTGVLFMSKKTLKEGFNTGSCPNVLIQKGSEFYLY